MTLESSNKVSSVEYWGKLLRQKMWTWMPGDETNIEIGPDGEVECSITLTGIDENHLRARYNEYLRRL